MSTAQVAFDPDGFMASRQTQAPPPFDPDKFMADRQAAPMGLSTVLSKTTGISASPEPTGVSDRIARWTENVANDIKYGTDTTGVGTVLKKMGAHGVYNGESQAVGDFMASLPLGLLRMAKGGAETNQPGNEWQGVKDIAGGAGQAATMPTLADTGGAIDAAASVPGLIASGGRKLLQASGNVVNRVTGANSAIREAELARTAALSDIETAKNANLSRYQLEEQKVAEANQAASEKYQQSLQEAQQAREVAKQANISNYQKLEQEVAQSKAAAPPPLADGEQQSWRDLNTAIRAPASSIKIGLGKGDLASAASMPGRGLAQEGFDAAALSKLNPVEQAALIGPKYQQAGRAVNDTITAATQKGTTLDVGKSAYKVFEDIPNPKLQEKAIEAFNETASEIGITDQRAVTPQEAVQLRRALQANAQFGPTGDLSSVKGIGTQLYRAVTSDLHEAVSELIPVDRHYGDMKEAVKAIQKNVQKFGANIPPAASKAVEDLTVAPYKPLPGLPEAPKPSQLTVSPYKPLPPNPEPIDRAAIQKAALLGKAKKLGLATLGGGAGYGAYRGIKDLIEALSGQ